MVIENDIIVHCEPLGSGSDCFTKLRIVLSSLWNAIFVCFNTNLTHGHLNAHRTHSRLRMRFYWPRMLTHCARCCRQCPVVRLQTLLSSFFHVDGYQFGVHKNLKGSDSWFIAADGMTSCACMKTFTDASATIYALTLLGKYIWCVMAFAIHLFLTKTEKMSMCLQPLICYSSTNIYSLPIIITVCLLSASTVILTKVFESSAMKVVLFKWLLRPFCFSCMHGTRHQLQGAICCVILWFWGANFPLQLVVRPPSTLN